MAPTSRIAHSTYFSPNLFNSVVATRCAAPESTINLPSMAPNPMISARLPSVPPNPALMDAMTSGNANPFAIPTKMAEIKSASILLSFTFMFKNRSKATPRATQIIGK